VTKRTDNVEMTKREASPAPTTFAELGLDPRLVKALESLGYEEPTPIQREAIPPLLAGRDVLGQAATGTGKTAAFALPMIQRLGAEKGKGVRGVILVPTRELAIQVAGAVHRYGRDLGVSVLPVYGGQSLGMQAKALSRGVDVVVATPGRALDLMRRRSFVLESVKAVVLDEADEMLDLGFAEDLEAILEATPKTRQTALFSATLPARIKGLAERRMRDPVRVAITSAAPRASGAKLRQVAYIVGRAQKAAALGRVLDMENPASALVFCRTRSEVDELQESLASRGYRVDAIHGGMTQDQRDRVMKRFRDGSADLLIATDVAARGLDIARLSHVVNYDVPASPEMYVHRTGRTGRAGRAGVAITLAQPREERILRQIEKLTRQKIEIATLPTVADLNARRLDITRAALREAIVAGGLERYRTVVTALAEEFEIVDVAAAAVKLVHEPADGAATAAETDLPTERASAASSDGPGPGPGVEMARVFVGAGRTAGVRPKDLVGAITKGAGVAAAALGAISIGDRSSIVEVRASEAKALIEALRKTPLRGKKVPVRLYEER
jgi:ATP-dependent RNA helicase DeaD